MAFALWIWNHRHWNLKPFIHQLWNAAKALLLMKSNSTNVLCLGGKMALSLHINIAVAEGGKKEDTYFWAIGIIFLKVYHCLISKSLQECWGMMTEPKIIPCKLQNSIIKSIKVSTHHSSHTCSNTYFQRREAATLLPHS